ncbi:MAG: hypothetical protein AUJ31_01660 [Parcubacteria group bacterium CG1_02_39_15]|uniref:Membrane fusion protein biotin-lipoyl like domain-containing protein n=3 Tax=Candidatus Nealsoniibacteriota TaxID=1817911 RepID=A0A2G9YSA5_9BACT|nr:MAG: hypothetical protein AUJ31_01660 [Parcubacteria group bacterium CG1_02_39_15]PIP22108.1 MAG: hypothetical protein COX38_02400 [Candidatus Nealsonbacteria bacterium CG23_combo_of_CG06-09_8_20_14_all_39_25]PIW89948.1 MAG: hypothetical protein COZ92_02100 [Candidatus Nealsonbacteria bacterium CG_4_8_14_3_um_filter_40_11]PIZ88414.1 MAG: hypothetical protein COX91_00225 [Candidatus Nealsonbacteria bacterium CG_4_10_14_0_2_um_filter_39_15]
MQKRTIFPLILAVLLLVFGIYQGFFKKTEPIVKFSEVTRGNVVQEVTETGQVKKGEEINLSFKSAGKVEKIYVEEGEKVEAGDPLAKLKTDDLAIQLQEAKAALALAQAKLDKLLAGATSEEIQKAKTALSNAKIASQNANQNLEDIKAQAEENLNAAYENAKNALEDAYLKAYNAQNVADLIQRTYFTGSDQEGLKVKENKEKIIEATSQIKSSLKGDTESTLIQTKEKLSEISEALKIIRETCQSPTYSGIVSSTDKSSLDTQRGYINTTLTNITTSYQTITSTKLANEANINTAQSQVSTAEGAVIAAEDELALIIAYPRQEDIQLNKAQVEQAEAQVQVLENQIRDATLRSPVEGQVVKVNKQEGELVQPMLQDVAIVLLPVAPFEVEADIYEEDVVKVEVEDPVDISLVAFPSRIFKGKVISINPGQKIVEGVVYYEVTITFEETPEGLKPGMTADLVIKTALKENVLTVPEDAIQKKDDKTIVGVLEEGKVKEKEVEVGLRGNNDLIEIISGLEEGEKVILP